MQIPDDVARQPQRMDSDNKGQVSSRAIYDKHIPFEDLDIRQLTGQRSPESYADPVFTSARITSIDSAA